MWSTQSKTAVKKYLFKMISDFQLKIPVALNFNDQIFEVVVQAKVSLSILSEGK
jgi:hypothetical protein